MAVFAFVVDGRAALHDFRQGCRVENLTGLRGAPDFFRKRERRAAIAIGHCEQSGAGVGVERERLAFHLLRAC